MKVKTQLVTGVLAAALALGSTICVYANPSVTAVPSTDHEDQYETGSVEKMADYEELVEAKPAVMDAIAELNESKEKSTAKFAEAIMKDPDEKTAQSAKEVAEELENCEFLTGFFDVYVKDNKYATNEYILDKDNVDVERTEKGFFKVTLKVPSLTSKNKNVRVIHYRKAVGDDERDWSTGEWEILVPISVDYEKKEVVVEFKDFSPAAILAAVTVDDGEKTAANTPKKEEKDTKGVTSGTTTTTPADTRKITEGAGAGSDKGASGTSAGKSSSSSTKSSNNKSSSSTSSSNVKSPKTGVTDTSMLWFMAAGILAGIAGITAKMKR